MSEDRTDLWLTESLRFTVFTAPSPVTGYDGWWQELIGAEPDTVTSRPKVGEFQQEGPFGLGRLIFSIEPWRIDWIYSPQPKEGQGGFSVLGKFEESLEPFLQLTRGWLSLPTCPATIRI